MRAKTTEAQALETLPSDRVEEAGALALKLFLDRAERVADPEARLRTFLVEYATLLAHDSSARLLISEAKRLAPEHYDEIRRTWRRGFDLVHTAIVDRQRHGRCRASLNPTVAAFGAIGMCSWIFSWFDYSRPDSAAEVAATMATVSRRGVLARD